MDSLEFILNKRPALRKVYKNGKLLRSYLRELHAGITLVTENSALHFLAGKTAKVYGIRKKTAFDAITRIHAISYADHHGLLHFGLLLNSNIVFLLKCISERAEYVPVFSTGLVPLDNISHPRGFIFHGRKFNFFSRTDSRKTVFLNDKPITINASRRGIESILASVKSPALDDERKRFLEYLLFDVLAIENLCGGDFEFSDQISILNHRLWPYFFDSEIRHMIPKLYYVQANDAMIDCLIGHLQSEGSLIREIVFNPDYRAVYLNNFAGISGCWDAETGPHFFNYVDENKKLTRMIYNNRNETLDSGDFSIVLSESEICKALKHREIVPTIFFDFLILCFLEGHCVLGGFNQIEYLDRMKQAHVKSMKQLGRHESAAQFNSRLTDGLICGLTPLRFESSIDMLWHYNSTDGKFNGNLDRGLRIEDFERILDTPVSRLIEDAVSNMADIVK